MFENLPPSVTSAPTHLILDSTKLKCADDCWRKFFFEYVLGWRPTKVNNHLIFGQAIHEAMEFLYLNDFSKLSILRAHDKFMTTYRKHLGPDTDAMFSPKTPENALRMLEDYAMTYGDDLARYEVVYTEIAGTVPVSPERVLHFKMDTILKDRFLNRHCSLEHKTSQSSASRVWNDQWLLSLQTGTYSHVLHSMYPDEDRHEVIINGLFFLKTKMNFIRVPVEYGVDQLRVWLWNINHKIDLYEHYMSLLAECSENDQVMRTFPMCTESCTKYYGCAFMDYCYTWSNPLRKCYEPPIGFEINHWNPAEVERTKEVVL